MGRRLLIKILEAAGEAEGTVASVSNTWKGKLLLPARRTAGSPRAQQTKPHAIQQSPIHGSCCSHPSPAVTGGQAARAGRLFGRLPAGGRLVINILCLRISVRYRLSRGQFMSITSAPPLSANCCKSYTPAPPTNALTHPPTPRSGGARGGRRRQPPAPTAPRWLPCPPPSGSVWRMRSRRS